MGTAGRSGIADASLGTAWDAAAVAVGGPESLTASSAIMAATCASTSSSSPVWNMAPPIAPNSCWCLWGFGQRLASGLWARVLWVWIWVNVPFDAVCPIGRVVDLGRVILFLLVLERVCDFTVDCRNVL